MVTEAETAGKPLRTWTARSTSIEGRAASPLRAPLVVLADNGCASACESFVSYARQLESSVVVGENTGGVGVFAYVLSYRLPRSGLGMTAGMERFHARDPSRAAVEGRGHLPDLWLDGDDPVKVAEAVADCLAKPACVLRRSPRKPSERR